MQGAMVVSLDFEQYWGGPEKRTRQAFGKTIITARNTIPQLLSLFEKYDIHATWGVVGIMLAEGKDELMQYIPSEKPSYDKSELSAYSYFSDCGINELDDPLSFANSLVKKILQSPNQEIGSHTFSHYYCLENGQTIEQFSADLSKSVAITKDKLGFVPQSLIFPRNEFSLPCVQTARDMGFVAVRGNPRGYSIKWLPKIMQRGLRLLDTYTNILGMKCHKWEDLYKSGICNITASTFFRAYNQKLFFAEKIKLFAIKSQMKYAAKKGRVFHIWWHPHNMGKNPEIFLKQLETLFIYQNKLRSKYGFASMNMAEAANTARSYYN